MFLSCIYVNGGFNKRGYVNLNNILEVHEMADPRDELKEFAATHFYCLVAGREDVSNILVNKDEFCKEVFGLSYRQKKEREEIEEFPDEIII